MSEKCCMQALSIGMMRSVAPKQSMSSRALSYVRFVVPKPGMVIAMMFSLGRLHISNACAVTISASVESSPPEMPTTAVFMPVLRRRVASPVA